MVTLAEIQDTTAREVARSHSSCILSFDLIGQHENKRFYVTEIVLLLGFADAIFRGERSDDRKCVCCSQASLIPFLKTSTEHFAPSRRSKNKFHRCQSIAIQSDCLRNVLPPIMHSSVFSFCFSLCKR